MAMLTYTIVIKTTLSNQVMHNLQPTDERDSAISVCSSEDCDQQVHLAVWQENIVLRSILRRLSIILFSGGEGAEEATATSTESEREAGEEPHPDGEGRETPGEASWPQVKDIK